MWETFAEKYRTSLPLLVHSLLARSHQHCRCCCCCCCGCAGVQVCLQGDAAFAVRGTCSRCVRSPTCHVFRGREVQRVSGGRVLSSLPDWAAAHLALPPRHNTKASGTPPEVPAETRLDKLWSRRLLYADFKTEGEGFGGLSIGVYSNGFWGDSEE